MTGLSVTCMQCGAVYHATDPDLLRGALCNCGQPLHLQAVGAGTNLQSTPHDGPTALEQQVACAIADELHRQDEGTLWHNSVLYAVARAAIAAARNAGQWEEYQGMRQRVEAWSAYGADREELLAVTGSADIASAAFEVACKSRPRSRIAWRDGARVVRERPGNKGSNV